MSHGYRNDNETLRGLLHCQNEILDKSVCKKEPVCVCVCVGSVSLREILLLSQKTTI